MQTDLLDLEQECTGAVGTPDFIPPSSAACPAMKVYWLRPDESPMDDSMRNAIEFLIVPEDPLFYAASRLSPTHAAEASWSGVGAQGSQARERVLMVMDRAFFDEWTNPIARITLPTLPDRYAAADPFMREVGAVLLGEFRAARVPRPAYLQSLASVVALHFANHHSGRTEPSQRHTHMFARKLERVTSYIDQHLGEHIEIARLAQLVHISPYHFARMFKQAASIPPHRYITLKRVERAKELLCCTEQSIVDIAACVGFQTQGHFTAVFHRHAGLTPKVFRLAGRTAMSTHRAHDPRPAKAACRADAMHGEDPVPWAARPSLDQRKPFSLWAPLQQAQGLDAYRHR